MKHDELKLVESAASTYLTDIKQIIYGGLSSVFWMYRVAMITPNNKISSNRDKSLTRL